MSGQESEIVELPTVNGASTERGSVDQSASKRTAMEHEMEERATSNGTTTGSKVDISTPNPPRVSVCDTEWLDLSASVIEEKTTKKLARALESGELPNLKVLFLEGNAADLGARAMLNALGGGHVRKLQKLILWEVSSSQQITNAEEGTDTIANAILAGNLPMLETMDLTGSLPKLILARTRKHAIKDLLFRCSLGTGRLLEARAICMGCLFCTTNPEKNQTLDCLRCLASRLQVYSGDDGIKKIARALLKTPINSLKVLILQQNYIGDKGASSLAFILQKDKLPSLVELDLQKNPVGYEGGKSIVRAYMKNPLLTVRIKLDWADSLLGEHAAAFRDSNIRLEHRLEKFIASGITRTSIVVDEYIELEHEVKYAEHEFEVKPVSKSQFRLHLKCQAAFAHYEREKVFKAHAVEGRGGIEISSRPLVGNSSQKIVQRYLRPEPADETVVDGGSLGFLSFGSSKAGRAINKIYIKSSTRYFTRAANSKAAAALCHQRPRPPKLRDATIEELLMLADSKPDEFYAMFGLRQVLLQNASGASSGKYSRVWICKSCFANYSNLQLVQPITTNAELEQKNFSAPPGSSPGQSPKPTQPEATSLWPQRLVKLLPLNRIKGLLNHRQGASHSVDA